PAVHEARRCVRSRNRRYRPAEKPGSARGCHLIVRCILIIKNPKETKMKLKHLLAITAFTAMAGVTAVGSVQAQEFKAYNARFGHGMADNHPAGEAAKKFAAEMSQATNGKMKISVIANQALGPDPQMMGALQGGVQEFYTGSA